MADTGRPLYAAHEAAVAALYADVENFARAAGAVLPGTPGSVLARTNASGYRFYAHQYYDAAGKKVEKYVAGPIGDARADAQAGALRQKIDGLNGVLKSIRLLAREGFKIADSKTFATLAVLGNNGLFGAGAALIGSHAYGAMLNQLGVRAAQYATQDVDIARNARLGLESGTHLGFLDMLKSSGIPFVEVPALNRKKPASSYKEAGRSLFQVDLLVPSASEDVVDGIPVPELKAHATALPYLRYLLGGLQDAAILAREGCCLVRIPAPERFALHKLIASRLRRRGEKAVKDIEQAAILVAVLSERHPGALEEAAQRLPRAARKHVAAAAASARARLGAHPRAVEALDAIAPARA